MNALDRVMNALGDRVTNRRAGGCSARCPAHDDSTPSLEVTSKGNKVLVHCHAGCGVESVVQALRLTMRDLFDGDDPPAMGLSRIVAEYDYVDEDGALLFQKVRMVPKDFRCRKPSTTGKGWSWKLEGVRKVLYNLPQVRAAIVATSRIIIVEGEKDVETLTRLGFVATCNYDGAATADTRPKWGDREAEQLRGSMDVVILPDNDDAGRAHANAIARSLQSFPDCIVRLVALPGLPPKGDVSDWVAQGGTAAQLGALIEATPPFEAGTVEEMPQPRAARRRIKMVCATDVSPISVDWLWEQWLPFGKLVALDGAAGVGKSTLIIDVIARATRGGPMPNSDATFPPVTVVIGGVEDGWADTIRPRLDAAGADLTRVHFITMAQLGHTLTLPDDVVELANEAAKLGATWLHFDTIYGVLDSSVNSNSDHDVRRALGPLKDLAEEHGILTTFIRHPRKQGGTSVNAGGGSVAFTALARVQLFVGFEPGECGGPNDKRRVLAVGKSNLASHPTSLAFHVVEAPNGSGRISWDGPVDITADEMAGPSTSITPGAERPQRMNPFSIEKAWLRRMLSDGKRIAASELQAQACADGLAWHRVKRAANADGVTFERADEFPSYSVWFYSDYQSEQSAQLEHRLRDIETTVSTAPSVPTGVVSNVALDLNTSRTFPCVGCGKHWFPRPDTRCYACRKPAELAA
jgi:putative DNA primase/helicase